MHEQLNSVGCVPFQNAEERRATEMSDVEWQLRSASKAQKDRGEDLVQNDDHLQCIQVHMLIVYLNCASSVSLQWSPFISEIFIYLYTVYTQFSVIFLGGNDCCPILVCYQIWEVKEHKLTTFCFFWRGPEALSASLPLLCVYCSQRLWTNIALH